MCGIFGLIEENNTNANSINVNTNTNDVTMNEISDDINRAFMKCSKRGPEYSYIERYKKPTPNTSPLKHDIKCPNCNHKIPFSKSPMSIVLGFHRLAINGLSAGSHQPFEIDGCILVCNGEIYNYRNLALENHVKLLTESDCEIIIHLYRLYGIEYTLHLLDGVFAFILYDTFLDKVFVARDPYGVRPLYIKNSSNASLKVNILNNVGTICFASEMKSLYDLYNNNEELQLISQFPPAHYMIIDMNYSNFSGGNNKIMNSLHKYSEFPCRQMSYLLNTVDDEIINNDSMKLCYNKYNFSHLNDHICHYVNSAVKKRVIRTTERPIACLLSGGLDSSIICALVNKYYTLYNNGKKLETYSIGLPNSVDLKYARIVANHLDTDHHEIVISEDDFFNAIPEVIKTIESYDTTTVRASVGNYLVAKYIKEHSTAKVIFNGDGADELMGGYLYMWKAPSAMEFDNECRRLLRDIYTFDVLRSDKCVSSHGLEPRTPFLDKKWVEFYLTISRDIRCHGLQTDPDIRCEKFLIRNAFSNVEPDLLPREVLWRTKEAFSDGVSSQSRSWYSIIDEKINALYNECPELQEALNEYMHNSVKLHNKPTTLEHCYYRYLYDIDYRGTDHLIPYFWLPKYVEAKDASARTLTELYQSCNKNNI